MALIPALVVFAPGTKIKSAEANSNFDAIRTAFNNTAVLTDVARTINVAHTFNNDILFTDASFDIGKGGATRPRDGFFSRNLTVGGSITVGTTLTVVGASALASTTVTGPFVNTGVSMGRFEGNGGGAGGAGPGLEIYKGGIQSFNRTTVALGPIQFDATGYTFNGAATFNNGIAGNLTGTVLTAAQANITSLGTLTSLAISSSSGVTPLSVIGINALSRFSRNEAAFTGAVVQFDRSGVIAGYIGLSSADHLTFQRGSDGANSATIHRGTGVWTFAAGIALVSTAPLYLDGGGDTYLLESAANQVDLYVGGAVNLRATTTTFALNGKDFIVDPTKKLYLDSGFDTYLVESAANTLDLIAGGSVGVRIIVGQVAIGSTANFSVEPTKRIYLDGGGDTYFIETAANQVDLFAGAVNTLRSTGSVVSAFKQLNITTNLGLKLGIEDAGLFQLSAGVMHLGDYAGATLGLRVNYTTGLVSATGGFSGNLTGTVLTASQTNITAVGTLTSLTVSGATTHGSTIQLPNNVALNGRNAANSADLELCKITNTNYASFGFGNDVTIGDAAKKIGFFAGGGVAKGAVTGSRGGNAALASLLALLANYGLVTDSSTA